MSLLRELYQEMILDHNKSPRNRRKIDDPTGHAEGHNPLCGDRVDVYLKVSDGKISDVSFEGAGCAISTASASMMTEAVIGKSIEEAHTIFEKFHQMVTTGGDTEDDDLEKLQVLAGVREYPSRIKCATLAWHTLENALEDKNAKVTTE